MRTPARHLVFLSQMLVCAALQCPAQAAVHSTAAKHDGRARQDTSQDTAPAMSLAARTVVYSAEEVIPVRTRLRFTTLLVLPNNERILDYTCGDKEFWAIDGDQNFAYVKPAKAGAQTNLNLVTASGNVYSFVLSEISGIPKAEPDLKIFIEIKDDAMVAASQGAPRFVAADEAARYKHEAEAARIETRQIKEAERGAVERGVRAFVSNVRFDYHFEAGKKPFNIRAMYHDDHFTYIQARPEETPTLYEIKDGRPNSVNFQYNNGVYVVDKILDRGYLVIGKQKLGFRREE